MYREERRTVYRSSARGPLCNTWNCFIGTTGALQVIIGILSIIFGIVIVIEEYDTVRDTLPRIGVAVWAGAWYILTGIVGLSNLCIRRRMLVTTYMVMSLLACVIAVVQIVWESIAVTVHKEDYETCNHPLSEYDCFDRLVEYLHLAATVTAVVELIVATCGWILAVCRRGCDCSRSRQREERVVVRHRRHHRQQPSDRVHYIDTSKPSNHTVPVYSRHLFID